MCQYINIVLPIGVQLDELKPILTKHGLGCHPFLNDSVLRQITKGGQLVNTTVKQCDCGSVIASASHPSSGDVQPNDIERLKRKGWSGTKINNWIKSKTKTNTQAHERDRERDQWTKFLEEVLLVKKIAQVGLYVHWYEHSIEDEEIVLNCRERVSIASLNEDTLGKLQYDRLYEFIP
jgi:hypothetical protein